MTALAINPNGTDKTLTGNTDKTGKTLCIVQYPDTGHFHSKMICNLMSQLVYYHIGPVELYEHKNDHYAVMYYATEAQEREIQQLVNEHIPGILQKSIEAIYDNLTIKKLGVGTMKQLMAH